MSEFSNFTNGFVINPLSIKFVGRQNAAFPGDQSGPYARSNIHVPLQQQQPQPTIFQPTTFQPATAPTTFQPAAPVVAAQPQFPQTPQPQFASTATNSNKNSKSQQNPQAPSAEGEVGCPLLMFSYTKLTCHSRTFCVTIGMNFFFRFLMFVFHNARCVLVEFFAQHAVVVCWHVAVHGRKPVACTGGDDVRTANHWI